MTLCDELRRGIDANDPKSIREGEDLMEKAANEIERLRAAMREARLWFLRSENVDLNGSDRVYGLIDDALGTKYNEQLGVKGEKVRPG